MINFTSFLMKIKYLFKLNYKMKILQMKVINKAFEMNFFIDQKDLN